MNKKLILEDYLKKIEKFQKLNEAYYDINKPLVADSEFDKLKLEIIKFILSNTEEKKSKNKK